MPEGREIRERPFAEKAALSAMMLDASAAQDVLTKLRPDDFADPHFRAIFETASTLLKDGRPVDFVTLTDAMEDRGTLDAHGGYDLVMDVATFVPSVAHIGEYIGNVIEKSTQRRIVNMLFACERGLREGWDATEAIAKLQVGIDGIAQRVVRTEKEYTVSDLISRSMARLQTAIEDPEAFEKLRVRTGWKELDQFCIISRSDLILVAGRPGLGKSALMEGLDFSMARYDQRGIFYSLEMPADSVGNRLASKLSGVPLEKIRAGKVDAGELDQMWQSFIGIDEHGLITIDDPKATVQKIYNRCKYEKARKGLDFATIDYLQMCNPGPEYENKGARQQEVANMSKAFKQMARELDIAVFLLCQLNREVDKRSTKKPVLSDLRESGALEQDADIVWMLYRESYFEDDPAKVRDPFAAELLIRKNRNGAPWSIPLLWNPSTATYRERV